MDPPAASEWVRGNPFERESPPIKGRHPAPLGDNVSALASGGGNPFERESPDVEERRASGARRGVSWSLEGLSTARNGAMASEACDGRSSAATDTRRGVAAAMVSEAAVDGNSTARPVAKSAHTNGAGDGAPRPTPRDRSIHATLPHSMSQRQMKLAAFETLLLLGGAPDAGGGYAPPRMGGAAGRGRGGGAIGVRGGEGSGGGVMVGCGGAFEPESLDLIRSRMGISSKQHRRLATLLTTLSRSAERERRAQPGCESPRASPGHRALLLLQLPSTLRRSSSGRADPARREELRAFALRQLALLSNCAAACDAAGDEVEAGVALLCEDVEEMLSGGSDEASEAARIRLCRLGLLASEEGNAPTPASAFPAHLQLRLGCELLGGALFESDEPEAPPDADGGLELTRDLKPVWAALQLTPSRLRLGRLIAATERYAASAFVGTAQLRRMVQHALEAVSHDATRAAKDGKRRATPGLDPSLEAPLSAVASGLGARLTDFRAHFCAESQEDEEEIIAALRDAVSLWSSCVELLGVSALKRLQTEALEGADQLASAPKRADRDEVKPSEMADSTAESESLRQLVEMGFAREAAQVALAGNDGHLAAAAAMLAETDLAEPSCAEEPKADADVDADADIDDDADADDTAGAAGSGSGRSKLACAVRRFIQESVRRQLQRLDGRAETTAAKSESAAWGGEAAEHAISLLEMLEVEVHALAALAPAFDSCLVRAAAGAERAAAGEDGALQLTLGELRRRAAAALEPRLSGFVTVDEGALAVLRALSNLDRALADHGVAALAPELGLGEAVLEGWCMQLTPMLEASCARALELEQWTPLGKAAGAHSSSAVDVFTQLEQFYQLFAELLEIVPEIAPTAQLRFVDVLARAVQRYAVAVAGAAAPSAAAPDRMAPSPAAPSATPIELCLRLNNCAFAAAQCASLSERLGGVLIAAAATAAHERLAAAAAAACERRAEQLCEALATTHVQGLLAANLAGLYGPPTPLASRRRVGPVLQALREPLRLIRETLEPSWAQRALLALLGAFALAVGDALERAAPAGAFTEAQAPLLRDDIKQVGDFFVDCGGLEKALVRYSLTFLYSSVDGVIMEQ